MVVRLLNQTNYADIYCIIDDAEKVVGTIENRLAGRDCGTYAATGSGRYNKRDIRRFYNQAVKKGEIIYDRS